MPHAPIEHVEGGAKEAKCFFKGTQFVRLRLTLQLSAIRVAAQFAGHLMDKVMQLVRI